MARLTTLKPRLLQRGAAPTHNWQPDDRRGSRHERGYGYAWEKLRLRVLAQAHGLCHCPDCMGGDKRLRVADQVHHIVSKAEARVMGWTDEQIDDLSNLMAINTQCHAAITARQGGGKHSGQ